MPVNIRRPWIRTGTAIIFAVGNVIILLPVNGTFFETSIHIASNAMKISSPIPVTNAPNQLASILRWFEILHRERERGPFIAVIELVTHRLHRSQVLMMVIIMIKFRTCHIETNIGTRIVSYVICVKSHSLISHLVVKMIEFSVPIVMTKHSQHVVMVVVKYFVLVCLLLHIF